MSKSIAIDGPSGAGKSTIAKKLAEKINFYYLDTGAMYRAYTYFLLNNQVDLNDEDKVSQLIETVNFEIKDGDFYIDDKCVNKEIRSKKVTDNVSLVSSYKSVRDKLVKEQRDVSNDKDIVLDGRDIGTNVLKDASIKFYLDATPEIRAKRRLEQLDNPELKFEDILSDIIKRDEYDSNREISPLAKAEDAIYIENSYINVDQVVDIMIEELKKNNVL